MFSCAFCGKHSCETNDLEHAPKACPSLGEAYTAIETLYSGENLKIAQAAARVEAADYCRTTRVEETMMFAREMGMKKLGGRQILVLCTFCLFSVGGQIIPKLAAGERLPWERLSIAVLPLVMTTFFEEFFFRGFAQARLEKQFGSAAAVVASGLLFSLYHLGYPGFRSVGDLALLLAVGIGFALAFRLSGNDFFVAYFVNLPNAFLTYLFKQEQFPHMTAQSTAWAGAAIAALAAILLVFAKHRQTSRA